MKRIIVIFITFALLWNCTPAPRYTDYGKSQKKKNQSQSERIDKERLAQIIESYLNTRYSEGGETKFGVDCSGLIVAIYRDYAGIKLPRSASSMFNQGKKIRKEELEFGDLLFFNLRGGGISHVGIYIGGKRFVHATILSGVTVSSLKENYYKQSFVGAIRVIE